MMQAVFVNTEQNPVKIKRLGKFSYCIKENKMAVSEWCEVFYPHPDAPDNALVSVYREYDVAFPYGADKLIKGAVDAVESIGQLTSLNNVPPVTTIINGVKT